jgi:hypothetical protein
MPRSTRFAACFAIVAAAGFAAGGCSPAPQPVAVKPAPAHVHDQDDDHDDDHAHPATLAEGVAALRKLATDIGTKLAEGSRDDADDIVHDLGHTLEDLPALAAKAKLSAAAAETANKAIGELEQCFGKLDEALHAAEGQGESPAEVHASLKDRIEAALKALEEIKE